MADNNAPRVLLHSTRHNHSVSLLSLKENSTNGRTTDRRMAPSPLHSASANPDRHTQTERQADTNIDRPIDKHRHTQIDRQTDSGIDQTDGRTDRKRKREGACWLLFFLERKTQTDTNRFYVFWTISPCWPIEFLCKRRCQAASTNSRGFQENYTFSLFLVRGVSFFITLS